jgi:hypothetical protein
MQQHTYFYISLSLITVSILVGTFGSPFFHVNSGGVPNVMHAALSLGMALAGGLAMIADAIANRQPPR